VDQPVEPGLRDSPAREELSPLVALQLGQLGLELGGERDHLCVLAVRSRCGGERLDRWDARGAQLGLAHVGGVEHGLEREETQLLQRAPLLVAGHCVARAAAGVELGDHPVQERDLGLRLLVPRAGEFLRPLPLVLCHGEVGQRQLRRDDVVVPHRVHGARHVSDVGILEAAHHVHHRVHVADVGEELVAQALARAGALDQARDVEELHGRVYDVLLADRCRETLQPLVGDGHHPDVRLDGAERIVGGGGAGVGEGVEQGGLPHVGEPDDAQAEHGYPSFPLPSSPLPEVGLGGAVATR
jgi:hypothetical protein